MVPTGIFPTLRSATSMSRLVTAQPLPCGGNIDLAVLSQCIHRNECHAIRHEICGLQNALPGEKLPVLAVTVANVIEQP